MLRTRLPAVRNRLLEQPDNPRFLCRLGWTCFRLAQAVQQRDSSSAAGWFYAGEADEAAKLLEEANVTFQRAARLSLTLEFRVEAYQGMANLFQAEGRSGKALAMLGKVLALQPNNWPTSFRMASLLQQMGQREASDRALTLSRSWRTPEWF
jgi:tetratricopeptide (TPR) repeat protein